MRTAIMFGSLFIAEAIRVVDCDDTTIKFYAAVIFVMMIMDVIDFIVNLKPKK